MERWGKELNIRGQRVVSVVSDQGDGAMILADICANGCGDKNVTRTWRSLHIDFNCIGRTCGCYKETEMLTKLWWRNTKGGKTLKRLRGKREGNSKYNSRDTVARRGTIFRWPSRGNFWTRCRTFRLHKRGGISWLAEWLSASPRTLLEWRCFSMYNINTQLFSRVHTCFVITTKITNIFRRNLAFDINIICVILQWIVLITKVILYKLIKLLSQKNLASLSSDYPGHILLAYTGNIRQQTPFRTISLTRKFLRCVVYLVKLQVTMVYNQKTLKFQKSIFAPTKEKKYITSWGTQNLILLSKNTAQCQFE